MDKLHFKLLKITESKHTVTSVKKENTLAKIRRLSKGGRGVYSSAADVDAFINNLRDDR